MHPWMAAGYLHGSVLIWASRPPFPGCTDNAGAQKSQLGPQAGDSTQTGKARAADTACNDPITAAGGGTAASRGRRVVHVCILFYVVCLCRLLIHIRCCIDIPTTVMNKEYISKQIITPQYKAVSSITLDRFPNQPHPPP